VGRRHFVIDVWTLRVGNTLLKEFSSPLSNPALRWHAIGARGVLWVLRPAAAGRHNGYMLRSSHTKHEANVSCTAPVRHADAVKNLNCVGLNFRQNSQSKRQHVECRKAWDWRRTWRETLYPRQLSWACPEYAIGFRQVASHRYPSELDEHPIEADLPQASEQPPQGPQHRL